MFDYSPRFPRCCYWPAKRGLQAHPETGVVHDHDENALLHLPQIHQPGAAADVPHDDHLPAGVRQGVPEGAEPSNVAPTLPPKAPPTARDRRNLVTRATPPQREKNVVSVFKALYYSIDGFLPDISDLLVPLYQTHVRERHSNSSGAAWAWGAGHTPRLPVGPRRDG